MKKMLIASFTYTNGNTQRIAEALQKATGADIARIETVTPYPDDYDATVEQAQREVNAGFMPEIKDMGANIADYDVIAVGTPDWWYTMAPAVRTFFAQNDWRDKTVVPFMTNAGWPGTVLDDMATAAEGAHVMLPFEARFDADGGDRMLTSEDELEEWIAQVAQLAQ